MPKGNRRGIVRETKHLKAETQRAMLEQADFHPIYELTDKVPVEKIARSFRAGDVAGVARLAILVDPALAKKRGQRAALYAAVDAIEDRGATFQEVQSGLSGADTKQRDQMIRGAAEDVTKGGRGLHSARNGARSKGRQPVEFSPEVVAEAKRIWENRKIKSWEDAAAKMPPGFTVWRAHRMFGKRDN